MKLLHLITPISILFINPAIADNAIKENTSINQVAETLTPTQKEILSYLSESKYESIHPENKNLPYNPSSWSIESIELIKSNENKNSNSAEIFATIKSNEALYLPVLDYNGRDIVFKNFDKDSEIIIKGSITYKRVGVFQKSWEMSFKWQNGWPSGKPANMYKNAVIDGTEAANEIRKDINEAFEIEKNKNMEKQEAAERSDRLRMEKALDENKRYVEGQNNLLISLARKYEGQWIPYTVVSGSPENNNVSSHFTSAKFINVTDSSAELVIMDEPTENSPTKSVAVKIQNGEATYNSMGCDVVLGPSENKRDNQINAFGKMTCPDSQKLVAILGEIRALKIISEMASGEKQRLNPVEDKHKK